MWNEKRKLKQKLKQKKNEIDTKLKLNEKQLQTKWKQNKNEMKTEREYSKSIYNLKNAYNWKEKIYLKDVGKLTSIYEFNLTDGSSAVINRG